MFLSLSNQRNDVNQAVSKIAKENIVLTQNFSDPILVLILSDCYALGCSISLANNISPISMAAELCDLKLLSGMSRHTGQIRQIHIGINQIKQ